MLFSSLIFLFMFLPLVLIIYYQARNRTYRNTVLLLFSLLFYSWGEPLNIFIMLIVVFTTYIAGLLINKYQDEVNTKRIILISSIMMSFSFLFYFKYFNFFIKVINSGFNLELGFKEVVLPIGISFFTFQAISYVFDLYRKEVQVQNNFFDLLLYVSFFPQLIAGPIVRYETVESEIRNRSESINDVIEGLKRFIIGLSKKIIISNQLALLSDTIFSTEIGYVGTAGTYLAAVAYTFQIYYDFSGYSDMAIGLGKMFGFNFLENFNYPYMASSITDFWRRWHISLSTWFRDYVYFPLGGNRVTTKRHILNLLIVWMLTGFWHGANYNYIIWGLYFGILLIVEKYVLVKFNVKAPQTISRVITLFLIVIGWMIFRVESISNLSIYLSSMFTYKPTNFLKILIVNDSIIYTLLYFIPALIFAGPWISNFIKKHQDNTVVLIGYNLSLIILLIINISFLISSSYNPFIYFRF